MISKADVPDAIFPTDNQWGVSLLDIRLEADLLVAPVARWGQRRRSLIMRGTFHFYTDDYKFSALWDDPSPVVRSACVAVIEPNISINAQMPAAVALYRIHQKRWLARYWQNQGIKIWVDLSVAAEHADLNLLGVPRGWRAYATRAYSTEIERLDMDYELACQHRGDTDVLFVVYGGLKRVQQLCLGRGWIWLPGDTDQAIRRVKVDGQE